MQSDSLMSEWSILNQRYIVAALALLRARIERNDAALLQTQTELQTVAETLPSPSTLETLTAILGLSPFERDLLLLCAGVELDATFPNLLASAQGDTQCTAPTFSFALATLPNSHWSALTPASPLRHWRLIEVGSGSSLLSSPLRIDERILHFLAGVNVADDRLMGLVFPVQPAVALVPSHTALAEQICRLWSDNENQCPLVQLCGADIASKRALAAAVADAVGFGLCQIDALSLPTDSRELNALMRLWEREALLSSQALLLECDWVEVADVGREHAVSQFVESCRSLLLTSRATRRGQHNRPSVTFEIAAPTTAEQRTLWQQALGDTDSDLNGALNGTVDQLIAQFSLGAADIYSVARQLGSKEWEVNSEKLNVAADDSAFRIPHSALQNSLWQACRAQARPKLDDLAQRITTSADWDDLVLPNLQMQILHDIVAHVRQRVKVYEEWGFGRKNSRGLGISALFAGTSGTGKTLAAEVLANLLNLDLYRIDLSQVVSKYIGETEKNLRKVFDAAEQGGAVLLFDEADALFGKRSEVKDSHDRYANIEVSYLLQRMEAYRGLAILTSNMKSALDNAFLRRIRFVVNFPFPDAAQRAEIWRRSFPAAAPTVGLDANKLARLSVAGGNIRNIALNAAFLAADADQPLRMNHLLRAAQIEYAKLEKPLTDGEIAGW